MGTTPTNTRTAAPGPPISSPELGDPVAIIKNKHLEIGLANGKSQSEVTQLPFYRSVEYLCRPSEFQDMNAVTFWRKQKIEAQRSSKALSTSIIHVPSLFLVCPPAMEATWIAFFLVKCHELQGKTTRLPPVFAMSIKESFLIPLSAFTPSLPGSDDAIKKAKKEWFLMITALGTPTLFLTVSTNTKWPFPTATFGETTALVEAREEQGRKTLHSHFLVWINH